MGSLAALPCLFLPASGNACGDGKAGSSLAGVQETARAQLLASPSPPEGPRRGEAVALHCGRGCTIIEASVPAVP